MKNFPIAKYAVTQSVAEVALGSLVHGFKIPLGGHLLSLNQAAILTLALQRARTQLCDRMSGAGIVVRISNTSAILKALSPIGNRVTPMVAISTQGILFGLGPILFGSSLFGAVLGAMALSVWGFVQPLLVAYLILGRVFFEGIEKLWVELAHIFGFQAGSGLGLLLCVVAAKMVLAATLAAMVWRSADRFEPGYIARVEGLSREVLGRLPKGQVTTGMPILGAFKDLFSPWVFGTLGLSVGCFAASGSPLWTQTALYAVRVVGGTLLIFWALRAVPKSWVEKGLSRSPGLKESVDQALARLSRT